MKEKDVCSSIIIRNSFTYELFNIYKGGKIELITLSTVEHLQTTQKDGDVFLRT